MRTLSRLRQDFIEWYDDQPELIQDIVDQTAHVALFGGIAAVVGCLSRIMLEPIAAGAIGATAGVICAAAYETWQNWGDENNDYADLRVDLYFEMGSALLVGTLVAVL